MKRLTWIVSLAAIIFATIGSSTVLAQTYRQQTTNGYGDVGIGIATKHGVITLNFGGSRQTYTETGFPGMYGGGYAPQYGYTNFVNPGFLQAAYGAPVPVTFWSRQRAMTTITITTLDGMFVGQIPVYGAGPATTVWLPPGKYRQVQEGTGGWPLDIYPGTPKRIPVEIYGAPNAW